VNVNKSLCISSVLGCLGLGQAAPAQEFDNSSFAEGCYVTSLYGNTLGPEINVDSDTGGLVPNSQKLVLHGAAIVGRVCSDGAGNLTEITATQNVAGLCSFPTTGMGTYSVSADGTGTANAPAVTIPADAVLAESCALLGIAAGQQSAFDFSFVLDGQECVKVITVSLIGPMGPIPFVTEGEACRQIPPQ
jgi:hypothetical protein